MGTVECGAAGFQIWSIPIYLTFRALFDHHSSWNTGLALWEIEYIRLIIWNFDCALIQVLVESTINCQLKKRIHYKLWFLELWIYDISFLSFPLVPFSHLFVVFVHLSCCSLVLYIRSVCYPTFGFMLRNYTQSHVQQTGDYNVR